MYDDEGQGVKGEERKDQALFGFQFSGTRGTARGSGWRSVFQNKKRGVNSECWSCLSSGNVQKL
jgi:hypothetical protein